MNSQHKSQRWTIIIAVDHGSLYGLITNKNYILMKDGHMQSPMIHAGWQPAIIKHWRVRSLGTGCKGSPFWRRNLWTAQICIMSQHQPQNAGTMSSSGGRSVDPPATNGRGSGSGCFVGLDSRYVCPTYSNKSTIYSNKNQRLGFIQDGRNHWWLWIALWLKDDTAPRQPCTGRLMSSRSIWGACDFAAKSQRE